jgi:crotonobetainyl-CoA:carnitine CoA-transferase CaiB-like acyl-CoA transferase
MGGHRHRPDDVELLPAWLGLAATDDDPWPSVATTAGTRTTADLMVAARGLGLPVGAVPVAPHAGEVAPEEAGLPVGWHPIEGSPVGSRPAVDGLRVVELASLWAGPLCGSLLADLGAEVVKVESTGRPDGARAGNPAFFALLNAGKQSVALDLADDAGRQELRALLAGADVVIEGSRPRALRALGIDADALVAAGPRAWISITAHGRHGDAGLRVGFGDDAAAAGGLVAWEDGEPRFCADAIGDPVTGLVAAAAALEAIGRGGHWLVDVAMARACAHLAGPTLPVPDGVLAAPPRATRERGSAA